MYKGTHPYQDIIYGYSLMVKDGKDLKTRIFDQAINPEEELIPSLKSDLDGQSKIICFGQGYLLKNLLPEDIDILDLRNMILDDSDFYQEMKDKSELERLRIIFGLQTEDKLPEYLSDAVAEHYYLKEFSSKEVHEKLKAYGIGWAETIKAFYICLNSI